MSDHYTVVVDTEHSGGACYVELVRSDRHPDAWAIHISDELIRQSPEAVHAALGLALFQMREEVR